MLSEIVILIYCTIYIWCRFGWFGVLTSQLVVNGDEKRINDITLFFPRDNELHLKLNELRQIYQTAELVLLYVNVKFQTNKLF